MGLCALCGFFVALKMTMDWFVLVCFFWDETNQVWATPLLRWWSRVGFGCRELGSIVQSSSSEWPGLDMPFGSDAFVLLIPSPSVSARSIYYFGRPLLAIEKEVTEGLSMMNFTRV